MVMTYTHTRFQAFSLGNKRDIFVKQNIAVDECCLSLKSGPGEIHNLCFSALMRSMSWLDNINKYFIVIFYHNKRPAPIATELSPIYLPTQLAGKGDCDVTGRVHNS